MLILIGKIETNPKNIDWFINIVLKPRIQDLQYTQAKAVSPGGTHETNKYKRLAKLNKHILNLNYGWGAITAKMSRINMVGHIKSPWCDQLNVNKNKVWSEHLIKSHGCF